MKLFIFLLLVVPNFALARAGFILVPGFYQGASPYGHQGNPAYHLPSGNGVSQCQVVINEVKTFPLRKQYQLIIQYPANSLGGIGSGTSLKLNIDDVSKALSEHGAYAKQIGVTGDKSKNYERDEISLIRTKTQKIVRLKIDFQPRDPILGGWKSFGFKGLCDILPQDPQKAPSYDMSAVPPAVPQPL